MYPQGGLFDVGEAAVSYVACHERLLEACLKGVEMDNVLSLM